MRKPVVGIVLAALVFSAAPSLAGADTIRVQSTTDTVDAGLVDGLLRAAYQAAQPGDTIQYVGVGTGKALDNAKAGLADVVITHAPTLEQSFVSQGYSYEPVGRAIFYSDYVIVGPNSDPAGVAANDPHDAIGAFERIASAGAGGTANFVSRGDNSGTNVQEELMWGLTTTPAKQHAVNGGSDANRFEPGASSTYPSWYHKTNKGQAANLLEASACNTGTYPGAGCYTIVDRGTFNRQVGLGTVTNMKIVADANSPAARGGENLLVNPFHAYIVNPTKVDGVNLAGAQRFVDFLTSAGFQSSVAGFPNAADPAFRPDAFPAVEVTAGLPASVAAGGTVSPQVTLTNRLPAAGAVSGIAVQLQKSTNGGSTFANVGAPVTTDSNGHAAFPADPVTVDTVYRVSTPRFGDLSPATQRIGGVHAVTPPDTTPPTVSSVSLGRKAINLTVSEASSVSAAVYAYTRTGVRRLKTVSGYTRSPGQLHLKWKVGLMTGVYRVSVVAIDRHLNIRTVTLRLHTA